MDVGEKMISGFWQAHPSFCDESGVDMFYMYFAPSADETKNMCWILITNKDQMITNHFTSYTASLKWTSYDNWTADISKPKCFEITFKELPEHMKDEFPKVQEMKIHLDSCKLMMSKDKKVYFVGYKESRISDLIDIDISNNEDSEEDANSADDASEKL